MPKKITAGKTDNRNRRRFSTRWKSNGRSLWKIMNLHLLCQCTKIEKALYSKHHKRFLFAYSIACYTPFWLQLYIIFSHGDKFDYIQPMPRSKQVWGQAVSFRPVLRSSAAPVRATSLLRTTLPTIKGGDLNQTIKVLR